MVLYAARIPIDCNSGIRTDRSACITVSCYSSVVDFVLAFKSARLTVELLTSDMSVCDVCFVCDVSWRYMVLVISI